MRYYIAAVLPMMIGFGLDCLIGDPHELPHPVRLIGRLISLLEKAVRRVGHLPLLGGGAIMLTVLFITGTLTAALLVLCYSISLWLGVAAESIICFYMLAARSLRDESMKVCTAAEQGDTEAARQAVSMIVGRDTSVLDRDGIIRAAVETVAENTSDGVTAPMMCMAVGGGVMAVMFKAANTMDSMLGYKNERYADIGRIPARLDDVLCFFPSRITALVMAAVCPIVGLDAKNAWRIWRRDRRKHASPNSAQTESACAGALHLRLAGDAVYFGEVKKKPFIGDNDRPIEPEDIRRANKLMYAASAAVFIASVAVRLAVIGGLFL